MKKNKTNKFVFNTPPVIYCRRYYLSSLLFLKIVGSLFLGLFVYFVFITPVLATSRIYPVDNISVSASVGQYYLNLSGFIAPYASIVLISDNNVLRSVVADNTGHFYLSGVLIQKGFSNFCLDAVDVKRLGESYTCFSISPATASVFMDNIFLPPTFGVESNQINQGTKAIIWGYSMPNAKVKVYLSDGRSVEVTTNKDGFYQTELLIDKSGSYEFFADAYYQNQKSLEPTRKSGFLALSVIKQLQNNSANLLARLLNFLLLNPIGIVFLILPIIILIFILLKKLFPSYFVWLDKAEDKFLQIFPIKERKLHHAWMVGY